MTRELRTRRYENLGLGLCNFKCRDCNNFCVERDYAKQLVEEGYRKESETAKEILQELYDEADGMNNKTVELSAYYIKNTLAKEYGVEIEE